MSAPTWLERLEWLAMRFALLGMNEDEVGMAIALLWAFLVSRLDEGAR